MRTFADALRLLMGLYPKFDLTSEQAATWAAALADCDPEALCTAALHLSRESQYPPSIKEWAERAHLAQGDGLTMTAAEAWDEMRRHRTKRAQTRYDAQPYMPKWSSEAVRRASEAVLWDNPDWTVEQMPTIRSQFERYFNAQSQRQEALDASILAAALMPGALRAITRGQGPRTLMGGDA